MKREDTNLKFGAPDIRFFGYGCLGSLGGFCGVKSTLYPPRQQCPKNRIPKTGAEETVVVTPQNPYSEPQTYGFSDTVVWGVWGDFVV